ncbi:MAG: hypothetical protein IJ783_00740 [Kiritimatiellae bacterium]|nr:hypothetical protein [Kiritimatiellia bacterium]
MKYALLAAAAVFAVGTSQAAAVESADTYEVITLPVAEGYNLYGVSVTPISDEPQYNNVFNGLDGNFVYNGQAVASSDALVLDAIWYKAEAEEEGFAYEVGKVNTAAADPVQVANKDTVLVPVVADTTLGEITVDGVGVSRYKAGKSLEISTWDTAAQEYVKYWYKTDGKWYTKTSPAADASEVQLKAGQAVYVTANSGAATITL